jgi:hypothetical protein
MTVFRNTAGGTLINGERFSFSVHTEKAAGDVVDAASAWSDAIAQLWNGSATPADSIKQLYPAATIIDELVTTELSPTNGHNVHQAISTPSLAGTGSGAALPPQTAICVSLRTGLPTRAGRGRFFLPAPIVAESSVGRINATAQGQIVAAVAGMMGVLTDALFPAVVYHAQFRTTDAVTSIDVGDVFDTIRRRRDKLIEVRMSSAV